MTRRVADLAVIAASTVVAVALLRGEGTPPSMNVVTPTPLGVSDDTSRTSPLEGHLVRTGRRFSLDDLTPELIASSLIAARDIDPALADRLSRLRVEDEAGFRAALVRSHRLLTLADLHLREPAMYELKLIELTADARVVELADSYRRVLNDGDAESVERVERDLRGALRLQLVFGLVAREDMLCRLRDVVAELEREVESDKEHFDDLVEERLQECRESGGPPPLGKTR